jgi:hypothetical protein
MNLNRLLFVCLLIFLSTAQSENLYHLYPVDEADRDLSFVKFRQNLLQIIRNRDPETFVKYVSRNVYAGSKDKRGMRNFVDVWQPQDSESDLWPTLEVILKMGGGFVRSEKGVQFCAPYVFTNFPDNLDIYGHGVIIAENVPLKSAPLSAAQNVSLLSYDLLKVEDWRSVEEKSEKQRVTNWIKVSTLSGYSGYVDKKMVRSPTDYSACFLFKPKTGWKIISLISNE